MGSTSAYNSTDYAKAVEDVGEVSLDYGVEFNDREVGEDDHYHDDDEAEE